MFSKEVTYRHFRTISEYLKDKLTTNAATDRLPLQERQKCGKKVGRVGTT